ncbi:MAG: HIT family protein [Butyrivibrio sp.]|nr:HIT family protein [Butyrivibrio sp.]
MENCIFCKIANGEIPSNTIYEDENFRVILDNGPATKGHALVLPKEHYADLFEIPEDVAAGAVKVAKKVAGMMKDTLLCDGLNLVQNNGQVAGQTVMHYHLHIIPRYKDDGQTILWKPTRPSADELAEIRKTICG